MDESQKPMKMPSPTALVRSSLLIYTVMAVVGFEIIWWSHRTTDKVFAVSHHDWYLDARITILAIAFLTLGQHCLEEFFPSYRRLKVTFAELFKGLSGVQVFLLAFASAVGEEFLFRGALQPFLGVWFTSTIFAMLHIDPDGKTWIWTIWAFIGGLVMGYATQVTGTLWAAMLIHFGVNAISISRVSKLNMRSLLSKHKPGPVAGESQVSDPDGPV